MYHLLDARTLHQSAKGLFGKLHTLFKTGVILFGKDMVDDRDSGSRTPNPYIDADKVTAAELFDQALKPIMPGRGSPFPDPDHPQGEIHLIKDNYHVRASLGGKVPSDCPTVIHIGQGLYQKVLLALPGKFGMPIQTETAFFQTNLKKRCTLFDHGKPYVMP